VLVGSHASREPLFDLNSHVAKLLEVMIEAGDWQIVGYSRGCDQAVHKMGFCCLEAEQGIQVNA
jgi:hypothetical protein